MKNEASYRLLDGDWPTGGEQCKQLRPLAFPRWSMICFVLTYLSSFLLVLFVGGLVGYNLGRSLSAHSSSSPVAFRTVVKTFDYNRTFSEQPTPENNAAWDSLFPPHGGFFHDKTIAEEGASLAVYHQLHCLRGIREAYWIVYDAVIAGTNVTFEKLPDYSTPWHTRHCIDFLRQMLMCNADVTIERNIPEIGGIKGFDVQHECKLYEDIFHWTLDRQADAVAQRETKISI